MINELYRVSGLQGYSNLGERESIKSFANESQTLNVHSRDRIRFLLDFKTVSVICDRSHRNVLH